MQIFSHHDRILGELWHTSPSPAHLGFLDRVLDVDVGLRVSNGVANPNGVSLHEEPVIDDGLDVAVEESSLVEAQLQEDDMKE